MRKCRSSGRKTRERLLQLRVRVFKGVAVDQRSELAPRAIAEERPQRRVMGLEKVRGPGITFREQYGQLRRSLAG